MKRNSSKCRAVSVRDLIAPFGAWLIGLIVTAISFGHNAPIFPEQI
jgi:hypothetical protein